MGKPLLLEFLFAESGAGGPAENGAKRTANCRTDKGGC